MAKKLHSIIDAKAQKRFWSRVRKTRTRQGCWIWLGTKNTYGYGQIYIGRFLTAHRVMWTITYGEIPKGLCVCHHCDNPACVRPEHLFLGTVQDNIDDKVAKGRQAGGDWPGSLHSRAKTIEDDVIAMREDFARGTGRRELARKYKVSYCMVVDILLRRRWKHI